MPIAIRRKTKPKHHFRNEINPISEDSHPCEYVSSMMKIVSINTYNGIHSLKVDLDPNRIMLTGYCESYYIKQLAQQAVMDMVIDMEIVNDIVVICDIIQKSGKLTVDSAT